MPPGESARQPVLLKVRQQAGQHYPKKEKNGQQKKTAAG
jgi:hypothetical protein